MQAKFQTCNVMTKTNKPFKDWDISDFKDMGSLAQPPIDKNRRPFYGFCKVKKGEPRPLSSNCTVSNLADVL